MHFGTRIVMQTETASNMQFGVEYYQYPQALLSTIILVSGGTAIMKVRLASLLRVFINAI